MKILIVSQYFWPENFRITDLAAGLVEMGHTVEVLTGMPNYPDGKLFDGYGPFAPTGEVHNGVRILRVPLVPRRKGQRMDLALNYLSFAVSGMLLGPLRCKEKYDCILVYQMSPITMGLPAIVLRALRGIPILFLVQDLWPESLAATGAITVPWLLARVKTLVRFIYNRCDRILMQSAAFQAPIMDMGVEADRLDFFPNTAEALYAPVTLESEAAEREHMPDGFKVMFAGNIGEAQDFPAILTAAECLKDYPDIHFVILGSGRKLAWVTAQVETRGLAGTFHLLGRHPVETMPRYFSLADAMLVTLNKDPVVGRTIPAKVQSYMACAKPIIAAVDGEGARVVKAAGAGLICPAEAPAELARVILDMYRVSAQDRTQMGAAGLRYFNAHFERNMLLNKLIKMMAETRRRK